MTAEQLYKALAVGRETAERAADRKAQLFIGGEMGIGNTTSATALSCVLLAMPAPALTGAGTGLDAAGVARKARVIAVALARQQSAEPLEALRCLGGFEIAALTGTYLRCGQLRIPALIDGFITTVAALIALRLQPELAPWLFYAHRSAEPAHRHLLKAMKVEPLLDLGMRLGEGSGAAVALPLLRAAAALHARMATFAEAGISRT
jgi:nicotinate-nucleotide--dimethylbenzimidazole phosphoribosyltransferase